MTSNDRRVGAAAIGRVLLLAFAVPFLASVVVSAAWAEDGVKGTATLSKRDNFARLIIKTNELVAPEVTLAGPVLIVRFKKPVDISVSKLAEGMTEYISVVRRDPDGTAIRFALNQKISVNTMMAGEQLFVDMLPASWRGMPPPLPQEVVQELADRARAAEQLLIKQRAAEQFTQRPPIRVRASVQPTFVRLSVDLPDGVDATSDLAPGQLRLSFSSALSFDLADAKIVSPPQIVSISQRNDAVSSAIDIAYKDTLEVKSFRDGKTFTVDISTGDAPPSPDTPRMLRPAAETPPAATPAPAASAPPPAVPHAEAPQVAAQAPAIDTKQPPAEVTADAQPVPEVQAVDPNRKRVELNNPASAVIAATRPTDAPPPPPPTVAAASPGQSEAARAQGIILMDARRATDGLRMTFPFDAPVSAAMFRRADTIWLVLDTTMPINMDALNGVNGSPIRERSLTPTRDGTVIRLKLDRPQLVSLTTDEKSWIVTVSDTAQMPTPLTLLRENTGTPKSGIAIALDNPGRIHKISDPDAGDNFIVVTTTAPNRAFLKRQDFVELRVLDSLHGVVIQPLADDITASIVSGMVHITRPSGLMVSEAEIGTDRRLSGIRPIFDPITWRGYQQGRFDERLNALVQTAAAATPENRMSARLEVARFYMARGFYAEAKGVMEVAAVDIKNDMPDPVMIVTQAVASILSGRADEGLKLLDNPILGTGHDSEMWRGLGHAAEERWPVAREKFKNAEAAVALLPMELQRAVLIASVNAALATRDYSGAAERLNELNVIGVPPELAPAVAVLTGQLSEALGRETDALASYAEAVQSSDRAAAAEGTLREISLRQRRNEIDVEELLSRLETLSITWRGNRIEIETLRILTRQYAELKRYRDVFLASRAATRQRPNDELSRQMQDDVAALFLDIFTGPKGDDISPIDVLSMFYEFRELTPIGRRGDELIRKLSDRLVGVDLLDQASELLQYQIDHRLEGSARAQVAARLAMIYLMNHKPERAIAALRGSRINDLAGELRLQRLLLEARAQSDVGRHDLALDIIANISGREAVRLRSDIYWAARRWREAAEQIEVLYGERWREFQPLNSSEKSDILRAAVGYALSDDMLGSSRLREKYAGKFDSGAERTMFEIAVKPGGGNSAEVAQLAKIAASIDTLDGFLREIRARFSDNATRASRPPPDPLTTGSLPAILNVRKGAGH